MSQVKKAIIPAAGLGLRFLPATKTVPKEMLTIVDAPIILYVVEEAIQAGIEDIVLIAGRGKHAIEDFFDTSFEIEEKLHKSGQFQLLERLEKIRNNSNIISIRQKQSLGLGHALLCAQPVIGNEPFAVLLGDEITLTEKGQDSMTSLLVKNFHPDSSGVVSIMNVSEADVSRYGIADLGPAKGPLFKVNSLVEKPQPSQTKSRWALTGRYVFDHQIMSLLREAKPSVNNEIQLTDSMHILAQKKDMWALPFQGLRLDAGDKFGYLKTNIEVALRHPELASEFRSYLLEKAAQLKVK